MRWQTFQRKNLWPFAALPFFYFFQFFSFLNAIDFIHLSINNQPSVAQSKLCQWALLKRLAALTDRPLDARFCGTEMRIGIARKEIKRFGLDIRKQATAASLFNATIVVISSSKSLETKMLRKRLAPRRGAGHLSSGHR